MGISPTSTLISAGGFFASRAGVFLAAGVVLAAGLLSPWNNFLLVGVVSLSLSLNASPESALLKDYVLVIYNNYYQ